MVHGGFGPSLTYRDFSVGELIRLGLPVNATLGGTAFLLATTMGIAVGCIAALQPNGIFDRALMWVATIGIAAPNFVLAPLLATIFGVWLAWLPTGDWQEGAVSYMVLRVLALSLPHAATVSRLTRAGMLDTLKASFVRTARAKGLPPVTVVLRHALPLGFPIYGLFDCRAGLPNSWYWAVFRHRRSAAGLRPCDGHYHSLRSRCSVQLGLRSDALICRSTSANACLGGLQNHGPNMKQDPAYDRRGTSMSVPLPYGRQDPLS